MPPPRALRDTGHARSTRLAGPIGAAREIGLPVPTDRYYLSWDTVLDLAVVAYWDHRVVHTARCGSVLGFYAHRNRQQPACPPCRRARAQIVAIGRRRKQRDAA